MSDQAPSLFENMARAMRIPPSIQKYDFEQTKAELDKVDKTIKRAQMRKDHLTSQLKSVCPHRSVVECIPVFDYDNFESYAWPNRGRICIFCGLTSFGSDLRPLEDNEGRQVQKIAQRAFERYAYSPALRGKDLGS